MSSARSLSLCLAALFALRAGAVFAAEPSHGAMAPALQPYIDRQAVAGVVALVATKDAVLDVTTAGFADVAAAKPMPEDALFWIASQSKPMTATAFMMLVDEGKAQTDALVEKYLPEFHGQWVLTEKAEDHELLQKPSHPITVREILSHSSGLPFSSSIEQQTLDQRPLAERVLSYALLPLQHQPGTKYQYSNAGINTAGRIIEVLSGMPYEQFMEERLFKPLGMKDTTFWPNEEQLTRLAKSYKPGPNQRGLADATITQLQYPLSDHHRQPMPAGGLFSTAHDTAIFCQMILNGGTLGGRRYLSEAAVKQMTSKQTPEAVSEGYGFGWSTDGRHFGHGGAYSTDMAIDTERGLITIYMVQHAGFPQDGSKALGAFKHLAQETYGPKPASAAPAPAAP